MTINECGRTTPSPSLDARAIALSVDSGFERFWRVDDRLVGRERWNLRMVAVPDEPREPSNRRRRLSASRAGVESTAASSAAASHGMYKQ